MDAVDCAVIASNPQTMLTDAVFQLLDTISKYLRYISDAAQCADINQLALWNNDSGTPTIVCQCAPGKVCNLGNDNLDTLLAVVGILTVIIALALLAFQGVTTPMSLVEAKRLRALYRHGSNNNNKPTDRDAENIELQNVVVDLPAAMNNHKNKRDTYTSGAALFASTMYFDEGDNSVLTGT